MFRVFKHTLLLGLPFGLVLALVEIWRHGWGLDSILIPLVAGLFAGLALAGYSEWHCRRLERMGVDTHNLSVRPRRRLRLEGGSVEVLAACRAALVALKGRQVKEEDPGVRFSTRTPMTFRSFGETVRLTVVSQRDGGCEVELSSAPVLLTTMIDYGKNLENVETVTRALAAQLPCHPVA
jgi:hypothetical protein